MSARARSEDPLRQIRTASTSSEAFVATASVPEAVEVVAFSVVEVVLRVVIVILLVHVIVFLRGLGTDV